MLLLLLLRQLLMLLALVVLLVLVLVLLLLMLVLSLLMLLLLLSSSLLAGLVVTMFHSAIPIQGPRAMARSLFSILHRVMMFHMGSQSVAAVWVRILSQRAMQDS